MPTLPAKLRQSLGWGRVMDEDVDQIGHYVRLLNRIITLIAVILAVPVILSTITAFVRNPPKVSTFDNLASAFIDATGRTIIAERTPQKSTPWQANLADPQEAGATETENVAPEGSLLVDHPRDAPLFGPSAGQIAELSSALAAMSNSAMPMVADGADGMLPPLTANDGAPADRTDPKAAMGRAGASDAEAHALSASASLPGPIRLPRPRPHNAGTVRTADTMLSRVPMPRPRPVAGDSGAQQDTATNSPSVPRQQQ